SLRKFCNLCYRRSCLRMSAQLFHICSGVFTADTLLCFLSHFNAPVKRRPSITLLQFIHDQFTAILMDITSITIVYADGSIVTSSGPFAPVTAPALPSPEDVKRVTRWSMGSTKVTSRKRVPPKRQQQNCWQDTQCCKSK